MEFRNVFFSYLYIKINKNFTPKWYGNEKKWFIIVLRSHGRRYVFFLSSFFIVVWPTLRFLILIIGVCVCVWKKIISWYLNNRNVDEKYLRVSIFSFFIHFSFVLFELRGLLYTHTSKHTWEFTWGHEYFCLCCQILFSNMKICGKFVFYWFFKE